MSFPPTWIAASGVKGAQPTPPLSQQVAQVWLRGVPPLEELLPQVGILSPEEQSRAERLQLEADRHRFLASRLFLRMLLSQYSGFPPESIRIEHSPRGKPYWRDPPQPIQFNLSHSHKQILVALVLRHRIGVDLEWIRPVPRWQAIAQRYFSVAEQAHLAHCPDGERDRLFFQIWTRTEALLKATGVGLAGYKTLSQDPVFATQRHTWAILPLAVGAGYAAAVAVETVGVEQPVLLFHQDEGR
ncbi:4'-phosphopantetheinyl transferase superfamily protein [Synechococcus sp. Nb3U1]|uniref:4'-phosphopantetheinyl transferase family protein n=1 Tax=Synechococcus sp. Nb3U1 TaxID=1914529 RepID=UPI001F15CC31|nr:4'-phosphopantetheinyl transferase superfamily protein [Synechococcus sp. Nb3U1]MCF2969649.1 4'-phosphopantetheinyl transferase superfamily protein [Synechococcus sp. Nb3U1]